MEIILKQNISTLGKHGEVVLVKDGYARNYLIPKGLAAPATAVAKAEIERERVRAEKQEAELRARLLELANRLADSSCTIAAQANEDGHLFGSVSQADIAKAFADEEVSLEPEQIVLEEPIREIGVYAFKVRLRPDIEIDSKVWVVKE